MIQEINYKPSFKAGTIYRSAEIAMRTRMSPKKFHALKENFEKMFKDSEFDVYIGTIVSNSNELDATIRRNGVFTRYESEGLWSSFFQISPTKFIERVNKIVQKELVPKVNNVK